MSTPIAIDANVIIRYLTGDDTAQAAAATGLFRAAQSGKVKLVVPTCVIQECVYVLETIDNLDAAAIAPKLISVLSLPNVHAPDARWLFEALQSYRVKNADFGDALLCAFAQAEKCAVATFDKSIPKKFPEVPAHPPTEWQPDFFDENK